MRTLVISIILLAQFEAFGQDIYTSDISELILHQWTDVDGLVSNNLTSVNQSSDGVIWVTSFNGIQRFNGKQFTLYDKGNVAALSTNGFYSTTENQLGNLVLASQGSGVLLYKEGQIEQIQAIDAASVRKVLVDDAGNFWCGTNNEGVIYFEPNGMAKVYDSTYFRGVIIWDIYQAKDKSIWFGTGGKGLVKYYNDQFIQIDLSNKVSDNIVTNFCHLSDDVLAVGTTSGVFFINSITNEFSDEILLNGVSINDLILDHAKNLWIATEQGLYRRSEKGDLSQLNEQNGLPHNQVSSVIEDAESNIWVTTKKAGLLRLTSGMVRTIGVDQGLISRRVNIVAPVADHYLIGCDDGEVYRWSENKLSMTNYGQYLNGNGVRDIAYEKGRTLIASYNGLTIINNNGSVMTYDISNGLSTNSLRRILVRTDGSIWLGTKTGGIIQFNENDFQTLDKDNGLESNYILALEEDKNQNLVIGTHSGGLTVVSNQNINTYYLPEIKSALIFNIHIDENNDYWLSTNVGIYRFSKGLFTKVEIKSPYQTDTFFDFVPDRQGNIWLSSNSGIGRISWDQIKEHIQGKTEYITADFFNASDGMINKECTGATRSYFSEDGDVWIPTIEGVAIVNSDRLKMNLKEPIIMITDFIVDTENLLSQYHVSPGKLRYKFGINSSSYTAPDKVRFKYKLQPIQEEWIETYEREVTFTSLPPGEYTFSVIGSNNSGIWNEEGANYEFAVIPFYYQTWWFRILIGLMTLGGIYFIFIWRVRRVNDINQKLTKANEELDKFVYSASHDLRAPLSSILGLAEVARLSSSIEEKDQCLELIKNSTVKLDHLINDIIEYSRNDRLELVYSQFEIESEVNDIIEGLRFTSDSDLINVNITTEISSIITDGRRLRVVLRNLLANAYLYHDLKKENPYISVSCKKHDNNVVIDVADNGLGISKRDLNKIFKMFYRAHSDSKGSGLGLYIAKENIEKLKGRLTVKSAIGEGTTFTITLPS